MMDIFEQDEKKQIRRNVEFIITTYKYSCPLYVEFGIAGEFIDKPRVQAEAICRVEIAEAIEKYESRAVISEIDFIYKDEKMIPQVKIQGSDEWIVI